MRLVAVFTCAALAACASGGAAPPGSPPMETVRVASGNGVMTTTMHPTLNANGGTVAFPLEQTWAAVRLVYDSLGIAVATLDAPNHIIGNPELKLRRRLGDVAEDEGLRLESRAQPTSVG